MYGHPFLGFLATAIALLSAPSPVAAQDAAPPDASAAAGDEVAQIAKVQPPGEEATRDRGLIDAFIWNTSPVALRAGLVLGVGLQGQRAIGSSPFFVGARLAFGETSEANREWQLTHLHGLAQAVAGVTGRWGVGRLRAQVGVGALVVRQLGERNQIDRLGAAGLADLRRDGWSLGPWVSAEVGASVAFREPWTASILVGPAFTVQTVSSVKSSRWLLTSGLGVGRAF